MARKLTGVENCRLFIDPPAAGAWNMAVDEVLLADAIELGVTTLRIYEWHEPTLSLGYFQRYSERLEHSASRNAAVVRRQSGGGAILHDRELTYSLVLPPTNALARDAASVYLIAHKAIISALNTQVGAAAPGWTFQMHDCGDCRSHDRDEPFLCFQRRASGDVLLVPPSVDAPAVHGGPATRPVSVSGTIPPTSHKIVGSAQRRRQGSILQHGSILLASSPAAPELRGLNDLIAVQMTPAILLASLVEAISAAFELTVDGSHLTSDLRERVAEVSTRKYAAAAWSKRR